MLLCARVFALCLHGCSDCYVPQPSLVSLCWSTLNNKESNDIGSNVDIQFPVNWLPASQLAASVMALTPPTLSHGIFGFVILRVFNFCIFVSLKAYRGGETLSFSRFWSCCVVYFQLRPPYCYTVWQSPHDLFDRAPPK
jgi:hypothetical protein